MMSEYLEILREILGRAFPNSEIPRDLSQLGYGSLDEWDSLGNFALLLLVEQRFNIQFTMQEMAEIRSLKDIINRIEQN
jgi:acyl carrier protein